MKKFEPIEDDANLSQVLREWEVESSLPPRFQEQVWKRIDQAEARKPQGVLAALASWIDTAFRRPAVAYVYMAVLLFVGLGAGYWRAQDTVSQSQSEWRARYVQSVDPYRAPRN
jgi:hypothetical protein